MIRLLFFLFREQFLRLAFNNQSKPFDFERLEQVFIDSNGKRYYKFKLDDDIPILRKGKLEQHLKELQMGLSSDNLDEILNYMELALNGGNKPSLARIGHAIEEMRNRKKLLIHPEILFDLVSTTMIREDENPAKIDSELHNQKVEQFKKDSQGGGYDFFYTAGLGEYIPYLKNLKDDWMEFFQAQEKKIMAYSQLISQYSLEQK